METKKNNQTSINTQDFKKALNSSLKAAVLTNLEMAKAQNEFILNNYFEKKDGVYVPIMVKFNFSTPHKQTSELLEPNSILAENVAMEVPLISISEAKPLAIDTLTMNFDLDLSTFENHSFTIDQQDIEIEGLEDYSLRVIHRDKNTNHGKSTDALLANRLSVSIELKHSGLANQIENGIADYPKVNLAQFFNKKSD